MNIVPLDVIGEHICKYLSFKDMGRAMQCNNEWMQIFMSDPCYTHFKRKVLKNYPKFQKIFDRYPWPFNKRTSELRPSKAKKRKKVWIFPRGGTRYVFKNWIRGVYDSQRFDDILWRKSNLDLRNIFLEEWIRSCFNFVLDRPKVEIEFIKLEGTVWYFNCNEKLLKMQSQSDHNIWLGNGVNHEFVKVDYITGDLYHIFNKQPKWVWWSSRPNYISFFEHYL